MAQKHVPMHRVMTKCHHILGLFPLGEARELRRKIRSFISPSALDTVQPLLLGQKLRAIQPDNAKVSWIIDYLADRPQFVPSRSSVLDLLLQRGTALSTSLIHTQLDCGSRHLHICSDDSSITGCILLREREEACCA